MSADQYLYGILQREAVDTGLFSPVRGAQGVLTPRLQEWAGNLLVSITPSGSFAKGTANRSGTDIDLFISLHSGTTASLKEIYETLHTKMSQSGYNPKRQNVSINVRVNGYDVDLVPAKRQSFIGEDHSLYRRKADTWTKTNVAQHIAHVRGAGRRRTAGP
jgi:tRNA nucleotidyltransferase (CCA-adding enzyme)